MHRILYLSAAVLLGVLVGGYQATYSLAAPPLRDTHENLNAVLWMETSAEYWALTTSLYGKAKVSLTANLSDKSVSAIIDPPADYRTKPAAIIMDLDETVFDNSPVQGQLVLDRSYYKVPKEPVWDAWVAGYNAELLPGAEDFIKFAEKAGVKIFFVTNRTKAEEGPSIENLRKYGITAEDANVLVVGENSWTSDKTKRREFVAAGYRVLLLVGDDLGDFMSTKDNSVTPPKDKTVAQRLDDTKKAADMWMSRWVILPNPSYGSSERANYIGVSGDSAVLAKKFEQVRGLSQVPHLKK